MQNVPHQLIGHWRGGTSTGAMPTGSIAGCGDAAFENAPQAYTASCDVRGGRIEGGDFWFPGNYEKR